MRLLKFWADWCNPCKQLTKTIDTFKNSHPDIEIVPINVEEDEYDVLKYKITTVPVLVKLDDSDVELARKTGAISLKELEEFILDNKE